jgi:endogenous inhibitor of DNA gyrase (YacG/DUF329 family)
MAPNPKASAAPACPICGAPIAARYRPFCSVRCANVDLGRWLNEAYVVPVKEDADDLDRPGPADQ